MSDNAASLELVSALESLVRISEAQSVALQKSREHAQRIEGLFYRKLADRISGEKSLTPLSLNDLHDRTSNIHDIQASHVERESAFMSAIHALMVLSADGATRETAARVFDLLRAMRLNDAGNGAPELDLELPLAAGLQQDTSEEGRHEELFASFREHQGRMREWMQKRQAAFDEQIARSDALLTEALALARTLLA